MTKLINQILKFGIIGGLSFLIDYGLLYFFTETLNIYYLISSAISFIVSLAFNYILSIRWVFDVKKEQTIIEISKFIILSILGLIINQLGMYILVDKIKIHYLISKIFITSIVMIWNFITRKIFIEK